MVSTCFKAGIYDIFKHHIQTQESDSANDDGELPSGELTVCYGKIHHFSWENPLFLWPFSIAMLVHQRVSH